MNPWDELQMRIDALATAVEADPKFFASILHYVKQLQESLRSPKVGTTATEIEFLAAQIEEFFSQWRPSGNGFYIPPRQAADSDSTVQKIFSLARQLATDHDSFENAKLSRMPQSLSPVADVGGSRCVFIGHGRSILWARLKVYLEDELELATVTYESESRVGDSIVPILEKMLAQATFAVLLLTAEDETAAGAVRARQNVIHEAGLFQGRLGFRRAVLLRQQGVEEFTNVAGLQYIPFSGDKIEQTFYELQRVLKREGQL